MTVRCDVLRWTCIAANLEGCTLVIIVCGFGVFVIWMLVRGIGVFLYSMDYA